MAKLDASNGFHIYGWMVTDLHLQGGDLLAFAIVHQFAQSQAGIYKGNTSYLSAWMGWTEKTSRTHLANLVEMGLIREFRGRENNTPYCYYELTEDFYEKHPVKFTGSPGKNFQKHPVKISESTGKKLPGEYNIEEKNIEKKESKDFIPPTLQELQDYCKERGNSIDPEYFLNKMTAVGWTLKSGQKVKDWKAVIRTWEKYDNKPGTPQNRIKTVTLEQLRNR